MEENYINENSFSMNSVIKGEIQADVMLVTLVLDTTYTKHTVCWFTWCCGDIAEIK